MTQHIVYRKDQLNRNNSNFRLQGISFTATAGQVTAHDWQLPQERWITGGQLICKNHVFGDLVDYEIVYKFQGGEVVLGKFVEGLGVSDDVQTQIALDIDYVSWIAQGLFVRIKYHSSGAQDVQVHLNLYTHIPKDII